MKNLKSLSKLLEYQDADIKLKRIMTEVEKTDDFKKIEMAKQEFAAAKKSVEDCEKNAAVLSDAFIACKKDYESVRKALVKLEPAIEKSKKDTGKTDELNKLIAELNKLKSAVIEVENKTAERKTRAEEVVKKYKSASERGRKIRDIHTKAKEKVDEILKVKKPEISKLKEKLAALEPEIDKSILLRYKEITNEGRYPAFVEGYADGKTYSCRGCGIALSQTNSTALTDNGFCVCESCRRVIYRKQN